MSNDSNYNMSTHKRDKFAEINQSFTENDQGGPFMDKLKVFGSTSPTPELRHYTQLKKMSGARPNTKDESAIIKVARNSSNNNDLAEYAQTVSVGVGRKTPADHY